VCNPPGVVQDKGEQRKDGQAKKGGVTHVNPGARAVWKKGREKITSPMQFKEAVRDNA